MLTALTKPTICLCLLVWLLIVLVACLTAQSTACPVTEPALIEAPPDPAVSGDPGLGYYYVNEDASMWAAAWWYGEEAQWLRATEEGVKVGWYRPAGATLEIMGRRLDGAAPPLHADIPCCYPTRFQATGLVFPTPGCWEVSATAAESALHFIVQVFP